jgi:hypothetical protein
VYHHEVKKSSLLSREGGQHAVSRIERSGKLIGIAAAGEDGLYELPIIFVGTPPFFRHICWVTTKDGHVMVYMD